MFGPGSGSDYLQLAEPYVGEGLYVEQLAYSPLFEEEAPVLKQLPILFDELELNNKRCVLKLS